MPLINPSVETLAVPMFQKMKEKKKNNKALLPYFISLKNSFKLIKNHCSLSTATVKM